MEQTETRAHYHIAADRARGLIRIRMSGFFTLPDVEAFAKGYSEALDTLGLAINQHLTLCDITAMDIQAQDIVSAFSRFMAKPHIRSRRLAFLAGLSLSRKQAERLTVRDSVQFFSDRTSAEAWLLGT